MYLLHLDITKTTIITLIYKEEIYILDSTIKIYLLHQGIYLLHSDITRNLSCALLYKKEYVYYTQI